MEFVEVAPGNITFSKSITFHLITSLLTSENVAHLLISVAVAAGCNHRAIASLHKENAINKLKEIFKNNKYDERLLVSLLNITDNVKLFKFVLMKL